MTQRKYHLIGEPTYSIRRKIKEGDRVIILEKGWRNGDWGKVILIDEDGFYHVAMFGNKNDCPVFEKKDLRRM